MESLLLFYSGLAGDDLKLERRGAITPADAFALFSQTASYAQERAFDYAPLNRAVILELARAHAKGGLAEMASALEASKGLEDKLAAHVTMKPSDQLRAEYPNKAADMEKGLVGLARSCFWNELVWLAQKRERKLKPVPNAAPAEVRFAANYEGWVSVKKAGPTNGREEVLACLASVYTTCSKRAAALACQGGEDALAAALQGCSKLLAGRRSIGRVAGALVELDRACQENAQRLGSIPEGRHILEHYLFDHALAAASHGPFPSGEDIGKVFPHLKVQKPRGRMPGKKAKP